MCVLPLGSSPITSTLSPAVGIVSLASWPCRTQQTAAPGGHQFLSGASQVVLKKSVSNEHLPVNNFLESSRGWNSSQLLHRSPQDLSDFQ